MASDWDARIYDAALGLHTQPMVHRAFLPLSPIFNAAGWYRFTPLTPTMLQAYWFRWTNDTGLIAGTRFGDELALLYTPVQIAASPLRDRLTWTWSGQTFAP